MKLLCLICVLLPLFAISQRQEDNLIIVTVSDTSKLYERVRQAITFSDFIIREDSGRDTLRTYSERIYRTTIFVVAKVVIQGYQVVISGAFGLGSEDFWGDPGWPKSYKRVFFYNKGNDEWWRIRSIALKLDGKIEYIKR